MQDQRFFDQALTLIEAGHVPSAMNMLSGQLYRAYQDQSGWELTREILRAHPLCAALLEDPYVGRAAAKPRGYAGDAVMIDYVYDQRAPEGTSPRALEMFRCSTNVQAAQGVRFRRAFAESKLKQAVESGKSICVLACGHLREADALIGRDLRNVVAVDQDPASIAGVKRLHGSNITLIEGNIFEYLGNAQAGGVRFDYIYTLGLTDYLDDRLFALLCKLMKGCLLPDGEIMAANFLPNHLAIGMMDAVMDWQLVYRDEADLARHAEAVGLSIRTFRDPLDCIAFCEMAA